MKTLIILLLIATAFFPGTDAFSQERVKDDKTSRKEQRLARKEERMMLKALRDSLMLIQYGDEEINVGYGKIKRRNLTTSVSKVAVEDDIMGSYNNIADYLRGRVPGLTVMKSGSGYTYSIRGINSIYGSTEPLFIVDGVEVSDIDHLNPRDVESVEVLKDASASIYGTRGACGVILITTKK